MPQWLPIVSVILVTAVALTAVGAPHAATNASRFWMAAILLCGLLAIAGSVWQGRRAAEETTALVGTSASPQGSRSERYAPAVADLTRQVKSLEDRVRELEARRQVRTITQEAADTLASYLRQFGSRHVIVSCIPQDSEAYQYANRLVNILRAANWQAHGPELTRIFGDIRAPGINIYVNRDDRSDTAKVLLDGFTKSNIPYQSRVTPSQAIPDAETVELFVGASRSEPANAGPD